MQTAQGALLAIREGPRVTPLPPSDALLLVLFSFLSPSFFTDFLKTNRPSFWGGGESKHTCLVFSPPWAFEFEAFLLCLQ